MAPFAPRTVLRNAAWPHNKASVSGLLALPAARSTQTPRASVRVTWAPTRFNKTWQHSVVGACTAACSGDEGKPRPVGSQLKSSASAATTAARPARAAAQIAAKRTFAKRACAGASASGGASSVAR